MIDKKIAIIGSVGLPAKYGGFETLTEYLTKHLANRFEITVYCSSRAYKSRKKIYNNAGLKYISLRANGPQSILYDIVSIISALRNSDVLLILGVSGCIILPIVKLISEKKVIVNIDGLEWKRNKWGKAAKWFLKYSEKLAVKYADSVVSDNKVIEQYVRETYNVNSELIAYGANHTQKEKLTANALKSYPFLNKRYAFKVCRIEPENNVHIILATFAKHPSLNLVIVGNWENSNYSKQLKLQFGKYKNIYLLDAIYDQRILNQIRSNSYLYVHGHSAGGTNPSLVEAMYLRLPVIAYGVNYNKETTQNKAKYFNDQAELSELLLNLREEELTLVAEEMRGIAQNKYSWDSISEQYAALF